MLGNKKVKAYTDFELMQLNAVRDMWRSVKLGVQVCVVSKYMVDWDTILGQYKESVFPYVESGDIYLKVEDVTSGDLQLSVEDLDNVVVEWDR